MEIKEDPLKINPPLFDWVGFFWLKRREIGITLFAFSLGIVFLLTYLFSQGSSQRYIDLENAYQEWKRSAHSLSSFEKVLKNAPNAEKRYIGPIAQSLVAQGKDPKKWGEKAIRHLEEDAPLHAIFTRASLLIQKEKWQEAFNLSTALKEQLTNSDETVLYGLNLVRIALLQEKLQNFSGEKAAWQELTKYLSERCPQNLAEQIIEPFQSQYIGLNDYSASRY